MADSQMTAPRLPKMPRTEISAALDLRSARKTFTQSLKSGILQRIITFQGRELGLRNSGGYVSRATCTVAFCVIATSLFTVTSLPGQSRQAKREAKIEESAQPRNVKGGVIVQVALPYDKAYDAVLNHLKRQGNTIDQAGKETGQIITAMDIKGGYSQTGTRLQVTCIQDSDTQTSIRVAVTEQKRKKLLQTEPWSDPKVNEKASATAAEELKSALTPKT